MAEYIAVTTTQHIEVDYISFKQKMHSMSSRERLIEKKLYLIKDLGHNILVQNGNVSGAVRDSCH